MSIGLLVLTINRESLQYSDRNNDQGRIKFIQSVIKDWDKRTQESHKMFVLETIDIKVVRIFKL